MEQIAAERFGIASGRRPVASGHVTAVTPPPGPTLPALCFADAEGGEGGGVWSCGVQLCQTYDQFVRVPGRGDIKVGTWLLVIFDECFMNNIGGVSYRR